MRNSNNKARCEKRKVEKCDGLCRTYSQLQAVYADDLAADETVQSFSCNVILEDFELGENFTTDFLITKTDGELAVRECVRKKYLSKPMNIKHLTASYEYWACRGIEDWGIVVDGD